ncbi:glycosyltransferase [Thermonema rossianum]|uniref:glycosyltransferase n=1 Tax=Thermonema rossianum TaxID=55505 RepID=UPI00068CF862|nr:glycosyltransferase [Thermonema rossianum]
MKTIIHIAEAFGGGIIEFILQIVKNQPGYRHIIIYGKRGVDIDAVRKQFPENAGFVEWPFAQREVHPIMDWKAFRSLRRIVKKIQREHSVQAIHLHSSKAGFLGRFALRGVVPGQRLIYTPHGLAFARQDVSKTMRLFYVLLEWVAAAYAGRVIGFYRNFTQETLNNFIVKNYS